MRSDTFGALPDEPLVSICVPAYNAKPYLAEALASILAQTYRRLEILVVDDASTDGTTTVANGFRDDRLRLVRNAQNLGGYQTMNKAINLVTGDLVAVYHADDTYSPLIVEREVAFLKRQAAAAAVFTQIHLTDATGRRQGTTRLDPGFRGRELFEYDEIFRFLLRKKNILLACPTFMARREVLAEIGPFDAERYHVAADLDMWIRIVRRYPIGILDEPLMSYRRTAGQWSQRYKRLRTSEELHFVIMDRYIQADGWTNRRSERELRQHEFHRHDDQTFRAANAVMLGHPEEAEALLDLSRYPWRALAAEPSRRKCRVLLLRGALRLALASRSTSLLAPILRRTE